MVQEEINGTRVLMPGPLTGILPFLKGMGMGNQRSVGHHMHMGIYGIVEDQDGHHQ